MGIWSWAKGEMQKKGFSLRVEGVMVIGVFVSSLKQNVYIVCCFVAYKRNAYYT